MSFVLTKFLPLLVYPLGLSILLFFTALFLLRSKRKWGAGSVMLFSLIVLWTCSTQVVADKMMYSLECDYPPLSLEEIPIADAIVVLGGMTRGVVPGIGLTDLGGAADRLVHSARLFKKGKAPLILLSGGNAPGYQPEAEAMADILALMDIPKKNMLLEIKSRSTQQNALYSKELFRREGVEKILLVTSASHMRRAEAIFKTTGVSVIPAATDYQLVESAPSFLDWLPQATALEMTTKGIKEYLGYYVFVFGSFSGR